MTPVRFVLVACVYLLTSGAAFAQIAGGQISGLVADGAGGLLPGATVTATHVGTGATRFDPNMEPHDHLVCDACGAVRDLPAGPRRSSAPASARRLMPGFELRSVEQIFRGLCAACARATTTSKTQPPTQPRRSR